MRGEIGAKCEAAKIDDAGAGIGGGMAGGEGKSKGLMKRDG